MKKLLLAFLLLAVLPLTAVTLFAYAASRQAFRSAVEAGETVSLGPLELNRERIGYKGKTLDWERVGVLRVEIGQLGRRLRIRAAGSLLPFCFCNLESFPNGVLLPEFLPTVAPPRLLAERSAMI